jgi:hypothetical protein
MAHEWRHALVLSAIIPALCTIGAAAFISDKPVSSDKPALKKQAVQEDVGGEADEAEHAPTFWLACEKTVGTLRVLVVSPKPWVFGIIFGGVGESTAQSAV